jgi:hypothetical protein
VPRRRQFQKILQAYPNISTHERTQLALEVLTRIPYCQCGVHALMIAKDIFGPRVTSSNPERAETAVLNVIKVAFDKYKILVEEHKRKGHPREFWIESPAARLTCARVTEGYLTRLFGGPLIHTQPKRRTV